MSDLTPVAFDLETTGFHPSTGTLTVYGFAHHLGVVFGLNTGGRPVSHDELVGILDEHAHVLELTLCHDEAELLDALAADAERLDPDGHYLTAFNGETWHGGFDLRFLRTKCALHHRDWPFPGIAYADTMVVVDRFATDDHDDLDGCYEVLVDEGCCDPFEDSSEAVDAWEHAEWGPLLLHNLADVQRTHELAVLAEQYVPTSDFGMKNLDPPG